MKNILSGRCALVAAGMMLAVGTAQAALGNTGCGPNDEPTTASDRDFGWDQWPGQVVDGNPSLRRWWIGDREFLLRVTTVPEEQCLPNPDEWSGAFDDLPGEYFVGFDRTVRRWWTDDGHYVWLKITVAATQEAGQADKRPPLPEFPNVDPGVVDPLPPYINKTPWLDPYPREFNGEIPGVD